MIVHENHNKEESLEPSLERNGGWYWQEQEKLSRQGELPKPCAAGRMMYEEESKRPEQTASRYHWVELELQIKKGTQGVKFFEDRPKY